MEVYDLMNPIEQHINVADLGILYYTIITHFHNISLGLRPLEIFYNMTQSDVLLLLYYIFHPISEFRGYMKTIIVFPQGNIKFSPS